MKSILLAIACLFTTITFAQTISTDAPSQSASPTIVPKGVFQIESRLQMSRSDLLSFQFPSNLFRIGLSNRFELRTTNGITLTKNANKITPNISNVELGLKFQVLNNKTRKTQIALLAHGVIPQFENDYLSAFAAVAINHQLNERNAIGYNLGYKHTSIWKLIDQRNTYFSLIYSNQMTPRLGLFAEAIVNFLDNSNSTVLTTGANAKDFHLNFDAGFTYLLRNNIQLDYSFGFNASYHSSFQAIGISFMIFKDNKTRMN